MVISNPYFVIGARYTDRRGTYEVIDISSDGMLVRYDGGREIHIRNLELAERIARNVALDERLRTPFSQDDPRNHGYFEALGLLAIRGRIEAIVPPKAREGFEQTYYKHTDENAVPGRDMYYLHTDPDVDKWGVELRISFFATESELHAVEGGTDVATVKGSEPGEYRINNNGFIWRLFQTGFRLGLEQEIDRIVRSVPDPYRDDFGRGVRNADA